MIRVTVTKGLVDRAIGAIRDLGQNRPPEAGLMTKIIRALSRALVEREAERDELIRMFDPSGQGWTDVSRAPQDLINQINTLYRETVDIEIPARLPAGLEDRDGYRFDPASPLVLEEMGLAEAAGPIEMKPDIRPEDQAA